MFKAHYFQKAWLALSLKCDVSLDEFEKAAQTRKKTEVELQKDVVGGSTPFVTRFGMSVVPGRWRSFASLGLGKSSVRNSPSTSGGFGLSKRLSEEHLKCLKLARKVGLDELEEDVDSLPLQATFGECNYIRMSVSFSFIRLSLYFKMSILFIFILHSTVRSCLAHF